MDNVYRASDERMKIFYKYIEIMVPIFCQCTENHWFVYI
jgi:hypothetical protein